MDNADISRRIDELWAEIDRAAEIVDLEQRRQAVEAVASRLEVEAVHHHTAPILFLLGYALYFHPDRKASLPVQARLENALRSALEVDPNYARAHMYLGHEAFDLQRYEEARSQFDKVEVGQLGSYWAMKVREMRVCCAIAVHGLAQSLDHVDGYVQIAEQHPPPDVWPTELYKRVEREEPLLGQVDKERLRGLLERLERAERFRK